MKKPITFYCFALASIMVAACSGDKQTNHDDHDQPKESSAKMDKWEEMDEFHSVMAESFHPYKDSANLQPAKEQAEEMAGVANKWANAPLPEKVDNEEVKGKLQKLKTEAEAFVVTAKSSDDKVIGESLTRLHNLFHEIQESWYGAEGHHRH